MNGFKIGENEAKLTVKDNTGGKKNPPKPRKHSPKPKHNEKTCFKCGKKGHNLKDCPDNNDKMKTHLLSDLNK